jgi:branched-chain amino acid transport system substrate-binding protein
VIKQGMEQAKSVDPADVAKALHSGAAFKTVVGDLSFDAKGDVTRADYVVYEWRKGADGKITYQQLGK